MANTANTVTVSPHFTTSVGTGAGCGSASVSPWTINGAGTIERQYNNTPATVSADWTMTVTLSNGSTVVRTGTIGPFTSVN